MKTGQPPANPILTERTILLMPMGIICLLLTFVSTHSSAQPCVDPSEGGTSTDWPMWRYDAQRSGASPAPLPRELHLQWVRELGKPAPAWSEEQYKLQFDRSYEPVVMGRQIFVPSMVSDRVTAYDTDSGRQNWQFFCDGPVRFAPIAWRGRVYFVSEDGRLYCLNAETGKLDWRFRLAPSEERVLGNGRLVSAWPARGGPVLYDGKIYCAASIWPFMGVFVYALDAQTGQVVWENSGTGATFLKQQHSSPAFGGVAPQGYMAVSGDKLLVTGRTTPACFDTKTGKLLYYPLSDRSFGKHVGGYGASIWGQWYFNNNVVYRLSDGLGLGTISAQVMGDDWVVGIDEAGDVLAYGLKETETRSGKDKKAKRQVIAQPQWEARLRPMLDRIHLQAGNRLYGSNSQGALAAIQIPEDDQPAEIVWRDTVHEHVWSMLAGDGKLFVVTEEGQLYCFGDEEVLPKHHRARPQNLKSTTHENRERIRHVLGQYRQNEGYCYWFGDAANGLLREFLRHASMHVVAFEAQAERVALLREELDRAGLYGPRVVLLHGDVNSAPLPPYLASLIVLDERAAAEADVERIFRLLRPYTGVAWVMANREQQLLLCKRLANASVPGCRIETLDDALIIQRTGPAPDSADWTHQYGDIANTVCSKDQLRLPLGILWFGEQSAFGDVLPRHAHGPPEQVVEGRLFIEGIDSLSARDVYTGRTLWKKKLLGLENYGVYFDNSYKHDYRYLGYSQEHIPGANARGTNFVATAEAVYVIQKAECHVLDARTGKTIKILSLPAREGYGRRNWGYIGLYGDYLIAGADFVRFPIVTKKGEKPVQHASFFDKSASRQLVVMNRHNGRVLWTVDANHGFLHNGIAVGSDTIFCLDAMPPYVADKTRKSDRPGKSKSRLLAMEVATGQILWEDTDRAFGSWLGYSEPFDILVQAYRKSRDMVWEPGDRMAAFQGNSGELMWDRKMPYTGPCMLHENTIITQESAYSLLTGRQRTISHPLTGESVPWTYSRNYGCGTGIASANLLTFRSAAAGYYDLTTDEGTGNFGGFRSGCTSNLVVANGVLNAPDYTRTCTCSYQNQTSLALVHMPDVETWTFSDLESSNEPIRRVGINFGAPGDRKADNGTLWLERPRVGGTSPELDVTVEPDPPSWFRRHSLLLDKGNLKWVEASGAKGVRSIRVRVSGRQQETRRSADHTEPASEHGGVERQYTVRLHFMEPEDRKPGQRVFDVAIGGKVVLKGFDIVAEAGGPNIGVMKEWSGIRASDSLTVSLTPVIPDTETIICGIEIVAENGE